MAALGPVSMPMPMRGRVAIVAKNLATIGLLAAVLPINLLLVATALVAREIRQRVTVDRPGVRSPNPKSVLISGGKMSKALQLARFFHDAGHRVVLIESHGYWLTGHRFSRAVDQFFTLPKPGAADYESALLAIIQREKIDIYVPVCSPVASLYDSRAMPALAALAPHCEVIHVEPDTIMRLDDKYQFAVAAQALGLAVPKSFLITDPQQVIDFDFSNERRPYILKSINYDSVRRLDLTRLPASSPQATADFARSLPISAANPWILQEFIRGQEFCTHGTFRGGELRVHGCCESSAFQINYAHIDRPDIEAWVTRFGAGLGLTGQASFDFIQAADDGTVYAIECNPRTHSAITMFYDSAVVADAYLGNPLALSPVRPSAASRPTYWIYHEVWRLLGSLRSLTVARARLKTIASGVDAVFDWRDPLPFLMLHHWHIPLLLLRDVREQRGWLKIDFNIGKLVQLGGD